MSKFAVQRTLTGITMDQLGDAQKAAIDTSAAPFDRIEEVLDLNA